MGGDGPGRCQASVNAPMKKIARRRHVLRSHFVAGIARSTKAAMGQMDSRVEKARTWAARIPVARERTGNTRGSRTFNDGADGERLFSRQDAKLTKKTIR